MGVRISRPGRFRLWSGEPLADKEEAVKALYAFPDHEVVTDLVPGIAAPRLRGDAALSRVAEAPGAVPVAIDPRSGGSVLWADIGRHPFREWQFMYTLKHLAECNAIADSFATDIDVLADDAVLNDPVPPKGFIFHISRCGSTLMAKALARCPKNIVINQGGPLQRGFWAYLTDDWRRDLVASEANLNLFRNLVLAMTRRRNPGEEYAFVKFISWNILYIDFVIRAFPDVPCLFLYRDPVEVIASVMKETTAALVAKGSREAGFLAGRPGNGEKTAQMSDTEYLAACYANYFRAALAGDQNRVAHVNYTNICRENFLAILTEGLTFKPRPDDLEQMIEQFQFHSKDDTDSTRFRADSGEKRAALPEEEKVLIREECTDLVLRLDDAANNLFADTFQSM